MSKAQDADADAATVFEADARPADVPHQRAPARTRRWGDVAQDARAGRRRRARPRAASQSARARAGVQKGDRRTAQAGEHAPGRLGQARLSTVDEIHFSTCTCRSSAKLVTWAPPGEMMPPAEAGLALRTRAIAAEARDASAARARRDVRARPSSAATRQPRSPYGDGSGDGARDGSARAAGNDAGSASMSQPRTSEGGRLSRPIGARAASRVKEQGAREGRRGGRRARGRGGGRRAASRRRARRRRHRAAAQTHELARTWALVRW